MSLGFLLDRPVMLSIVMTVIAVVGSVLVTVVVMRSLGTTDLTMGVALAVAIPLMMAPWPTYLFSRANRRLRFLSNELRRLALTDMLTGLANRRAFFERGNELLDAASRNGAPAAVIMVDLDRFKWVNDTFGHAGGDAAIQAVAGVIGSLVRDLSENSVVARLGGEEFAMVIAGADERLARRLAADICDSVRTLRPLIAGRRPMSLTASVGVAIACGPTDVDTILRQADEASYLSKRSGRDRWTFAGTEALRQDNPRTLPVSDAA